MMLKRGVSPLIATVLLVMIVVSIGAAVMVVIQGLNQEQMQVIEAQQDLLRCGTDVKVSLLKIGNTYRVCREIYGDGSGGGNITLYMENTGQRDISGFRVVAYGDQGFDSSTYRSETLEKGTTKLLTFSFTNVAETNSQLSKIEINPIIEGRDSIICRAPNLEFEDLFLSTLSNCSTVTWDSSAVYVNS